MNLQDRLKRLTAQELQDLFSFMSMKDMQLIVDALRAVAGDTESLERLQRLHVSIEQPILKLLKLAEGYERAAQRELDSDARFFRPTGGFTNGKKFIEVRLAPDMTQLETLIHYHNGRCVDDVKGVYDFKYITDMLELGSWKELEASELDGLTDPEIPTD